MATVNNKRKRQDEDDLQVKGTGKLTKRAPTKRKATQYEKYVTQLVLEENEDDLSLKDVNELVKTKMAMDPPHRRSSPEEVSMIRHYVWDKGLRTATQESLIAELGAELGFDEDDSVKMYRLKARINNYTALHRSIKDMIERDDVTHVAQRFTGLLTEFLQGRGGDAAGALAQAGITDLLKTLPVEPAQNNPVKQDITSGTAEDGELGTSGNFHAINEAKLSLLKEEDTEARDQGGSSGDVIYISPDHAHVCT